MFFTLFLNFLIQIFVIIIISMVSPLILQSRDMLRVISGLGSRSIIMLWLCRRCAVSLFFCYDFTLSNHHHQQELGNLNFLQRHFIIWVQLVLFTSLPYQIQISIINKLSTCTCRPIVHPPIYKYNNIS